MRHKRTSWHIWQIREISPQSASRRSTSKSPPVAGNFHHCNFRLADLAHLALQ
jgi:hypothetical protein